MMQYLPIDFIAELSKKEANSRKPAYAVHKWFGRKTDAIVRSILIYMFSDGYADQFGGPNYKKYNYASLKTFLLKIHQLPLSDQKQRLEKEFYEWKGENSQIDDILILGLKI